MQDYEKLGVFYMGRPYDLTSKKSPGGMILYDSKDLVTHAVCVGMTGSGKTGLCIALLEEALIDNIPAIAIDPKGDLTNLLLSFPDLRPEDFRPWINEDDARKKGLTPDDFAKQQADLWKNGLNSWSQDGERIRRLRQSADFAIYTPGSNAGIPVSILKSFAVPPQVILDDNELLRERINTTVTSLLGLIGIDADPVKSREHILLSTIINMAWQSGRNLDIAAIIQEIQTPPVTKIGVLDLDSFYPAKERFNLALSLNNLLAAPGFTSWMEGESLDIDTILYSNNGKPKLSIFSIAHLSDSERMFFVSLLLNQILGWMRTQSGTTSLRAIVYMDEIFGYFPPVANPPSKTPLLTLLKQARAFGVGIVLSTQNPVDLDYKGLANTGTWFIGRLQTERDKARVLEGLEGAAAGTGVKFDKQGMEQILAGLSNRIFLMNNARNDIPVVFETRWALSYLRGPLTRNQIKLLMDPIKTASPVVAVNAKQNNTTAAMSTKSAVAKAPDIAKTRSDKPILPPEVNQYFVPVRSRQGSADTLIYQPALIGTGEIHFADIKTGLNFVKQALYKVPIAEGPIAIDWDNAEEIDININDLEKVPVEAAGFSELSSVAKKSASYTMWTREFATWLYQNQKQDLWKSTSLKEFSKLGESERDFRVRLQQKAREQRDIATEQLRQKYGTKMATAQEQLRRAQQVVEREAEQAKQQKMQTAISLGATLLGSFLGGGKSIGSRSIGRATTTVRGVSRSMKETQDIKQAEETVQAVQEKLNLLEADFRTETEALAVKIDPLTETLEQISIRPAKKDIVIQLLALSWLPYRQGSSGQSSPAW